MAKRAKAKSKNEGQPFPVTQHRTPEAPPPAQSVPVANGPTTGYRDGDGYIEYKQFDDGKIPKGWVDTPAKCKTPYVPEDLVRVD